MKLERNWEIKAGWLEKAGHLYRKGGFDPRFYLYRYRFNTYPSRFKTGRYPLDVIAESSNVCNLRCLMCFQADAALPVTSATPVPFMSMELFKNIVDQCSRLGVPALKLSWRGEPLLNPRFVDMLKYAKSKRILEVSSLTNATLMDEGICRSMVSAPLDQLIVSIDGFSKETYEKIRVGADHATVVRNLNTLIAVRGRARKPFIRLQYTESAVNRHETGQFYRYWKDRVDEISVSYCQDFGSPQKDDPAAAPVHEFCCKQPFQRLVIMTDGTVCVCATDVMGSIAIGNAGRDSLEGLWRGSRIEEVRRLHRSGRYHENPMCRICVHNVFKANQAAGR